MKLREITNFFGWPLREESFNNPNGWAKVKLGDPVNVPPVASFLYTAAELKVNFDASGSTDPNGDILTYSWDFGDGQQGSGKDVQHGYSSAGSFEIVLTVTDPGGLNAVTSQSAALVVPLVPEIESNQTIYQG